MPDVAHIADPRRRSTLILAALLAVATLPLAAAPNEVVVVLSKREGVHRQFSARLAADLAQQFTATRVSLREITAPEWPEAARSLASPQTLVISVGAQAARAVHGTTGNPVVHTLIPRQLYAQLATADGAAHTAVYLDQPLRRQLELVQLALPKARTLAVLWGSARGVEKELTALARERGLRLVSATIESEAQLLPALHRVLEEADVLLAVPDPLVFNAGTLHHVLLTTYRYRIPVIGLSAPYVEAGALAAVYSSPEQIARQTLELIAPLLLGRRGALPPPQWPRYYSVAVNARVAGALGLTLPAPESLERELALREAR
jgi:ABC-type uncharacterized transport system substrate-binding protein